MNPLSTAVCIVAAFLIGVIVGWSWRDERGGGK